MMRLYVREEFFGSIIYNPFSAKYFNINVTQTEKLLNHIEKNKCSDESNKLLRLVCDEKEQRSNISIQRIKRTNNITNKLSAPLKLFFNVTKKCNLFCKHCYNDSGYKDSPELSFDMIVNTLQELEQRGIFKLTLAGGEPLFHPGFDNIIDYCQNTDLAISIVTNGICISDRRAKLLEECANIRSITVSLDGVSAHDNDSVRGEGAFEKTMKGIKHLRKHYSRDLSVRITLMKSNIEFVDQLPLLLSKMGINEIKINSVNDYGRATGEKQLLISQAEYLEARQQLFERATQYGISVEVPSHKYQRDENDQIGLCKAGEETFEIDGDGAVYPCSFSFGRFLAGNIHVTPFDEIFKNLSLHSINNPWCYQCKGRGGKAEKVFGKIPCIVNELN